MIRRVLELLSSTQSLYLVCLFAVIISDTSAFGVGQSFRDDVIDGIKFTLISALLLPLILGLLKHWVWRGRKREPLLLFIFPLALFARHWLAQYIAVNFLTRLTYVGRKRDDGTPIIEPVELDVEFVLQIARSLLVFVATCASLGARAGHHQADDRFYLNAGLCVYLVLTTFAFRFESRLASVIRTRFTKANEEMEKARVKNDFYAKRKRGEL